MFLRFQYLSRISSRFFQEILSFEIRYSNVNSRVGEFRKEGGERFRCDVNEIIGSLKSLSVSKKDQWKVKDAIDHMESVQRRTVVTAKDIQGNIDDTMEAMTPCFQ